LPDDQGLSLDQLVGSLRWLAITALARRERSVAVASSKPRRRLLGSWVVKRSWIAPPKYEVSRSRQKGHDRLSGHRASILNKFQIT
jgi:hypothetical protein